MRETVTSDVQDLPQHQDLPECPFNYMSLRTIHAAHTQSLDFTQTIHAAQQLLKS